MNNKGIAMLGAVPMYIIWSFAAVVVASVALTPSHRERKAIEKCEAVSGMTKDECTISVKSWPKDVVLAYIKDEGVTGNGGNFPGGNSN